MSYSDQFQIQDQITLNALQRKNIHKTLDLVIEALELCISNSVPSEWQYKPQVYDNSRPPINDFQEAQSSFEVALFGFNAALMNRPPHLLEELRDEFYKWFDGTGINVNNYPHNLSNVFLNTYEVLNDEGKSFAQETAEKARNEIRNMSEEERAAEMQRAFISVQSPLKEGRKEEAALKGKKYNEIIIASKFEGKTEKGKYLFEQIINAIKYSMNSIK